MSWYTEFVAPDVETAHQQIEQTMTHAPAETQAAVKQMIAASVNGRQDVFVRVKSTGHVGDGGSNATTEVSILSVVAKKAPEAEKVSS